MKTVSQLLCLFLILFLFGVNVYRAATQSITCDEALTYNVFVWPELPTSLNTYDANHHVLHTLLCKLSVRWFGLSEFGLRVPSLAGGLLLLISAFRLVRYLFGRGWFSLFALATITLNPLVLDYLSAARGYSLALGFLFWGLFLLTRYLSEDYDPPVRLLFRAGVAFGLSVAANLVFVVPVTAAGLVFTALVLLSRKPAGFAGRFRTAVDRFWGPAVVPAFLILALPLTHAAPRHFYYGAKTLDEALGNFLSVSLMHTAGVWALAPYLPHLEKWTGIAMWVVLPALTALILSAAGVCAVRWARTGDLRVLRTPDRGLLLSAGTIGLSFVTLVAAHVWLGVLYPLGRTGVYWPPLFTLAALAAAAGVRRTGAAGGAACAACVGVLAVALGLFVAGFTTDQYPEWQFDAGTRRIVQLLRERHRAAPAERVRLGATWVLEPSLNFYRHRYHLDWIQRVTRTGPDGDYDYYVLLAADKGLIERRRLRPLYTDPVSEATLACAER